eukprot:PLAT12963.1.p1 GENE.PLAT12963.1~~PLAT12963.1.p1  ORF type:complete len:166 (-),score=25.96 PLAT12963.1:106-603(-)
MAFELLSTTYWSAGRPLEVLRVALPNSSVFSLWREEDGACIGMARVISDHSTIAYLSDVVVEPASRGYGLGRWFLQHVFQHPRFKTATWMLLTHDAQELYRKHFGFGKFECMMNPVPFWASHDDAAGEGGDPAAPVAVAVGEKGEGAVEGDVSAAAGAAEDADEV